MEFDLKMQQYVDWKVYNVTKIKTGMDIVWFCPIWMGQKWHSRSPGLQQRRQPVQIGIK